LDQDVLQELNEKRRMVRPLLSPADPGDALTSYYALWHDARRTQLTLHQDQQGRVTGFVAVCQTGVDLFRPLVTLRAPDNLIAGELLHAALTPERVYQVVVPVGQAAFIREHMDVKRSTLNRIHLLDPAGFQPVLNVLVQPKTAADGTARFEIRSQAKVAAMAGTNWRSPTFAEVYVYVHPQGRGRGWGKSVVSACCAHLFEERLRPLYMVEEGNEASQRIAEALGFVDSERLEFSSDSALLRNVEI
jgi:RimJ/RimL family protein N-acetyltransferase